MPAAAIPQNPNMEKGHNGASGETVRIYLPAASNILTLLFHVTLYMFPLSSRELNGTTAFFIIVVDYIRSLAIGIFIRFNQFAILK